jgi:acetyl esterase/lipase
MRDTPTRCRPPCLREPRPPCSFCGAVRPAAGQTPFVATHQAAPDATHWSPRVPDGSNAASLPSPLMQTIPYGPAPDQVGDLYLPTDSRAPLVCLLHGGFWRMPYGRDQLHPVALDLSQAGLAVWNLEYRRVGPGGAAWPATLRDVEAALSHLADLQKAYPAIDLDRLCLVGHSAGGQLAFWGASRARHLAHPLRPVAALGLAPLLDLVAAASANLGNGAVQSFLGGPPLTVPERYQTASPTALLPLGVRQWVLHGEADAEVPPSFSQAYVALAQTAGDEVTYVPLARTDHMALIDPTSAAYRMVRECLLAAT